ELSSVSLPAAQLIDAVNNVEVLDSDIDMLVAQGTGTGFAQIAREGKLAHLEGRIARSIVLRLPEGTEHNLLTHPRFAPALMLPAEHTGVAAGDAGVLSLETLQSVVQTLLSEHADFSESLM